MLNRLSVKEMGTNNQKTTHQSQIFAGVSQSLSKPFKRIAGVCFTQVFTESPATLYFSCLQLNIHRVKVWLWCSFFVHVNWPEGSAEGFWCSYITQTWHLTLRRLHLHIETLENLIKCVNTSDRDHQEISDPEYWILILDTILDYSTYNTYGTYSINLNVLQQFLFTNRRISHKSSQYSTTVPTIPMVPIV